MTSTARRKSLKEDQLVTTTFRVTDWAQEHFNQVIIGIVALVAIVAVLVFAANSREGNAREAERQMGAALTLMQQDQFAAAKTSFQQIAERHGGEQGAAARFFKASCELREGNYAQAIDDFDAYLTKKSDYPVFESAACIGKAMAQEGLRDYLGAATTLREALGTMDTKDPRYYDAAYQAADFYLQAGKNPEALEHFEIVAKDGSGDLKARAAVMVSLLK